MAKGLGQGERAKGLPILSLLLSSTFVFLRSPFRATVHYPLSTVHYAWNRLVHSGPENFFSNADARDLQMSIQEHLTSLKAHTHAATIQALALVKRHYFPNQYHRDFIDQSGQQLVFPLMTIESISTTVLPSPIHISPNDHIQSSYITTIPSNRLSNIMISD